MFNKVISGLFAAATLTSVISAAAPAHASGFTWGNWTDTYELKDKSTDKSGFQDIIGQFQQFVQAETQGLAPENIEARALDPSQLKLKYTHDIRVWFINEGAGYKNQLAYDAIKGDSYKKGEIFNDISCTFGCELGNGAGAALDIGDYVDLGTMEAGTQLNFWLRADGKNSGNNVYGAFEELNPDKIKHMVAYEYKGYLLMGFEDLFNGGDLDYNDAVFVVDFGKGNLINAASVPEPSSMIALLGVTGAGMMVRRRRRQNQVDA